MKWHNTLSAEDKTSILEESPKAEQLGELTARQLDLIYKNKWFHLLMPKELHGSQQSLMEFALFVEELATVDGSFAWAVNLGAGANMFAGFMEPETAKTIFSSEKSCVAGSGAIAGKAKIVSGGYEINGMWKYASGSKHATHFSLNSTIEDDEDNTSSFLVPAEFVIIKETWDSMGLKASSSCDFEVIKAKIPFEYAFDLQNPSKYHENVLYRFPFLILAEINMLVMLTGLAKSFYDQCMVIAKNKIRKTWSSETLLAEEALFKQSSQKLYLDFLEKRELIFKLLFHLWEKVEMKQELTEEEKNKFTNLVLDSAIASRKLVDGIFPPMGMSVIYENSRINRSWRDFKVASQHSLLSEMRRM